MEEDEEDECLTIDEGAEPAGFQPSNPKTRKLNPSGAYYNTSGGTMVSAEALNTLKTFVNHQTGLNFAQVSQSVFNNQADDNTAHHVYNSHGDLNTAQQFFNNQAVLNSPFFNNQVEENTVHPIFNNQVGRNTKHPVGNNQIGGNTALTISNTQVRRNTTHPVVDNQIGGNTAPHIFNNQVGENENAVHPIFSNQVRRNTTHPIVNNQIGGNIAPHIFNNQVGENAVHPNQVGRNTTHPIGNNQIGGNTTPHMLNNQVRRNTTHPVINNQIGGNTAPHIFNNQVGGNTAHPIINNSGSLNNAHHFVNNQEIINSAQPVFNNQADGNTVQLFAKNQASPNTAQVINYASLMKNVDLKTLFTDNPNFANESNEIADYPTQRHLPRLAIKNFARMPRDNGNKLSEHQKQSELYALLMAREHNLQSKANNTANRVAVNPSDLQVPNHDAHKQYETNYRINNQPELLVAPSPQILGNLLKENNTLPTSIYRGLHENMTGTRMDPHPAILSNQGIQIARYATEIPPRNHRVDISKPLMNRFATSNAYQAVPMAHHQNQQINMNGNSHVKPIYPHNPGPPRAYIEAMMNRQRNPPTGICMDPTCSGVGQPIQPVNTASTQRPRSPPPRYPNMPTCTCPGPCEAEKAIAYFNAHPGAPMPSFLTQDPRDSNEQTYNMYNSIPQEQHFASPQLANAAMTRSPLAANEFPQTQNKKHVVYSIPDSNTNEKQNAKRAGRKRTLAKSNINYGIDVMTNEVRSFVPRLPPSYEASANNSNRNNTIPNRDSLGFDNNMNTFHQTTENTTNSTSERSTLPDWKAIEQNVSNKRKPNSKKNTISYKPKVKVSRHTYLNQMPQPKGQQPDINNITHGENSLLNQVANFHRDQMIIPIEKYEVTVSYNKSDVINSTQVPSGSVEQVNEQQTRTTNVNKTQIATTLSCDEEEDIVITENEQLPLLNNSQEQGKTIKQSLIETIGALQSNLQQAQINKDSEKGYSINTEASKQTNIIANVENELVPLNINNNGQMGSAQISKTVIQTNIDFHENKASSPLAAAESFKDYIERNTPAAISNSFNNVLQAGAQQNDTLTQISNMMNKMSEKALIPQQRHGIILHSDEVKVDASKSTNTQQIPIDTNNEKVQTLVYKEHTQNTTMNTNLDSTINMNKNEIQTLRSFRATKAKTKVEEFTTPVLTAAKEISKNIESNKGASMPDLGPDLEITSGTQLEGLRMNIGRNTEHVRKINNIANSETVTSPQQVKMKLLTDVVINHSMQNNNELAATDNNMIKQSITMESKTQNAFIKSNTDKIFTQQNINANKTITETANSKTKIQAISTTQTTAAQDIIHDIESDKVGSRSNLEISVTQLEGLNLNMEKSQAITDVKHASKVNNIRTGPLDGKVKILTNIETDKRKQINNEQAVTKNNVNSHYLQHTTIGTDKTFIKSKTDKKDQNENTDKTLKKIVLNKTESKVEHGKNNDSTITTEILTSSHQVNIIMNKDKKKRKHNKELTVTDVDEKKYSEAVEPYAKRALIKSNTDNNLSQNVNADKTQTDKIETLQTVEQAKTTSITALSVAEDIHNTESDKIASRSDLETSSLSIDKTQAVINAGKIDSSANDKTVISPQEMNMKMSNNIKINEKNNEQTKIENNVKKHSIIYNIHKAYMKIKTNRKHHETNADKIQSKKIKKSETEINKAKSKMVHAKKVGNTAITETMASSQVKLTINTDVKKSKHHNNERAATDVNVTKHSTDVKPYSKQAFTKSDTDNILSRKNVNADKASDKREIPISVEQAKSTTQTAPPASQDIHSIENANIVSKSDSESRFSTPLEGLGLAIDKTQASMNTKHAAKVKNNAITAAIQPCPLEVAKTSTNTKDDRKQNKNERVAPKNHVKKYSQFTIAFNRFMKSKMNRKNQKKIFDKKQTKTTKISKTDQNKAKSKVKHAKKIAITETVASSHLVNIKMSTDIKKTKYHNNDRTVPDVNVKKHSIGDEPYAKQAVIKSNTANSLKNVNADKTQRNKREIPTRMERAKSTTKTTFCAADDTRNTKSNNIASISDPEIRSSTHLEGLGLSINKRKASINNIEIAKTETSPLQVKAKTRTNMEIANKKHNNNKQVVTENIVIKRSNIYSQQVFMKSKTTKKPKKPYTDKIKNKIITKTKTLPIFIDSATKKTKKNRSKRGQTKNNKANFPDTVVREKSTNCEFQTGFEPYPKKNSPTAVDLIDEDIYHCIANQIQDSIDKEGTKSSGQNTLTYNQQSKTNTHNDQVDPQAMVDTKKPSMITGATAQETSSNTSTDGVLTLLKINSYKSQTTTKTSRSIFQTSNDILLNSENTNAETVINTNSKLSSTSLITQTVTIEQQTTGVAFETLSIDFLKSVLENATRKPVTKLSDNNLSDQYSEDLDTREKYTVTNTQNKEEIVDKSESEKFYRARQKLARWSMLDKNKMSLPDCAHDIAKTKKNVIHNYSSIISYVLDKYLSQMTPMSGDVEVKHDICNVKDEPVIENNNYLEPLEETEVDENRIKKEKGTDSDEKLNIDDILFYNFQLEFFPRLFCKLNEQGYHESAKKVDFDIYNLIYQSDDSDAKPEMEFKCPVCNSVSIYSPQEIYNHGYNHRLIQSVNMVRYCPICITFRIQYITLLKKYIDEHTKKIDTSIKETDEPSDIPCESLKCNKQNKPECTETYSDSSLGNEVDSKLNKKIVECDPLFEQMSRITGDPFNSNKSTNHDLKKSDTEKKSSDQQDDKTTKIMVKLQCNMLKASTVESLIKLKSNENKKTIPSNNVSKKENISDKKVDIKNVATTECVKVTNPENNGLIATHNANNKNKNKKEDPAVGTQVIAKIASSTHKEPGNRILNIGTNDNENKNKNSKSNQNVRTLTESIANTHDKVSIRICIRDKETPYIINKNTCSENIKSNKNIINKQTNYDNTKSIKNRKNNPKGINAESKNKKMFNDKQINNKQKTKTLPNSNNKKSKKSISEKHRKADHRKHKVADVNSKISKYDKRKIIDHDDQTTEKEDSSSTEDDNDDETTQKTTKALNNAFKNIKDNLKENETTELPQALIKKKTNPKLKNSKPKPDVAVKRLEMLYTCNFCTVGYSYLGPYLKHIREKHEVTDMDVPNDCIYQRCAFCPKMTTKETHNSHIIRKHPDVYNKKKDQQK